MKLIIEIDSEYVNEETDLETFLEESRREGAALILQVGSPISEEESHIARCFQLHADKFTARTEEVQDAVDYRQYWEEQRNG